MWIAIVLLITFLVVLYILRAFRNSHEWLLSAALLITLLVSPYLYNYDFLLLLVPLAVLIPKSNFFEKIILSLCHLLPTVALILWGRDGNIVLILASLALAILLLRRARNPVIDFPPRPA